MQRLSTPTLGKRWGYAKKYAWPLSLTCGATLGLVGPHLPAATPRVHPFGKIRRRGRKASPANEAPIDNQVDARAEGRRLTRQKDGGPNQLINGGHAAERRVSLEFFYLLRHLWTQIHRCGRIARANRINPDTSITPLHG